MKNLSCCLMPSLTRVLALSLLLAPGASNSQGISATLDERDPIVASTVLLTTAYFTQRWEAFCQRMHPETVTPIRTARAEWMARHETLHAKAGDIFTALLTTQQRRQMMANWKAENELLESRLAGATRQESRNWCVETPNTFAQPEMNILERSQIAATIRNYQI